MNSTNRIQVRGYLMVRTRPDQAAPPVSRNIASRSFESRAEWPDGGPSAPGSVL